MKVAKFGGTSLANAAQIKKVFDIVVSDSKRKIVVVSAPGKRNKDDVKITDLLIDFSNKYINQLDIGSELDIILNRFAEIAQGLNLNDEIIKSITADIQGRLLAEIKDTKLYLEQVKALGEDTNAKLIAYYFQSKGIEAQYINPKDVGLYVSNEISNARVLPQSYENLKRLKDMKGILIFPGFFGYTLEENIVTFPRGGSDITGSILAAATNAELYENFTDVDSVFVVNPNLIPNPKEIKELSFKEMRELAYAGFSVINDEALMPAYQARIPVNIKNTNNPDAVGTMIVTNRSESVATITGIASDNGFCSIYVSKYLMNREIGFGRRLLKIIEDEGLSYEHTPSGIDNISVVLREKQFTAEVEQRVISRIKTELDAEEVVVQRNLSLIMIVGEGMRRTIGLAARATKALLFADVNIEMINQGSSEVSMMFGIHAEDEKVAVKAIYNEFFNNN